MRQARVETTAILSAHPIARACPSFLPFRTVRASRRPTGLDASWNPTDTLTAYVWYQNEHCDSDARGHRWFAFEEILLLRGGHASSWAKEPITTNAGPSLPPTAPSPDLRPMLHQVNDRSDEVGFAIEHRFAFGIER